MNILKYIKNEEGVALMMALVVATISLAIMSSLVYMLTLGTQVSGMKKRYATALEAGQGGVGIVFNFFGVRGNLAELGLADETDMKFTMADDACITDKISKDTADWDPSCNAVPSIDVYDTVGGFDFVFLMSDYAVFAKIVNTVAGNSAPSGVNLQKGGVAEDDGSFKSMQVPYIYVVEVETRKVSNYATVAAQTITDLTKWQYLPERANFQVFYQY